MSVLRDRVVLVLLLLVLAGSAVSVGLALTRTSASGAEPPPEPVAIDGPEYAPADLEGPGGEALDAAVEAVPLALGYDHRDLDAGFAAATERMTDAYAEKYDTYADDIRTVATQRREVVEAVVRGAGVVRTTDDRRATCLLYVDEVLVEDRGDRAGSEPVVRHSRALRVEMVLRDTGWLVADITRVTGSELE